MLTVTSIICTFTTSKWYTSKREPSHCRSPAATITTPSHFSSPFFFFFFFVWKFLLPLLREKEACCGNQTWRAPSGSPREDSCQFLVSWNVSFQVSHYFDAIFFVGICTNFDQVSQRSVSCFAASLNLLDYKQIHMD